MNKFKFILFGFNTILSLFVIALLVMVCDSLLYFATIFLVFGCMFWNVDQLGSLIAELGELEARKNFWSSRDPLTGWEEIHEGHHVAVGIPHPLSPDWNPDKHAVKLNHDVE